MPCLCNMRKCHNHCAGGLRPQDGRAKHLWAEVCRRELQHSPCSVCAEHGERGAQYQWQSGAGLHILLPSSCNGGLAPGCLGPASNRAANVAKQGCHIQTASTAAPCPVLLRHLSKAHVCACNDLWMWEISSTAIITLYQQGLPTLRTGSCGSPQVLRLMCSSLTQLIHCSHSFADCCSWC